MTTPTITLNNYVTLTGLPLAEAVARLDEELPAAAYSAIPGPVDLTDIDPAYMRQTLNEVFGVCGLGWGYAYDPHDLEILAREKTVAATLKRLEFWYVLVNGQPERHTLFASGASENRNFQYAMKGAITNAIGNAASYLGFQESVYLGKRSHATVRAEGPKQPGRRTSSVNRVQNGAAATVVQVDPGPKLPAPAENGARANGPVVAPVGPRTLPQGPHGPMEAPVGPKDPHGPVDAGAFWKRANAALKAGVPNSQVQTIAQAARQTGWSAALAQLNQLMPEVQK